MNNTKGTAPGWRTVLAIDHCPKALQYHREQGERRAAS